MFEVIDISPGILIPACALFSSAFCMMYSAYQLNKQGDNIQPWHLVTVKQCFAFKTHQSLYFERRGKEIILEVFLRKVSRVFFCIRTFLAKLGDL